MLLTKAVLTSGGGSVLHWKRANLNFEFNSFSLPLDVFFFFFGALLVYLENMKVPSDFSLKATSAVILTALASSF